ncbi:AAA family ATPase [Paraburkholderia sp. 22099]|uniref:AAA domain-containing protein n=1 Tax=Paraburkholderia terricola TaxID=169427 RepID=A0A1M6U9B3_9BURK|nr:MULTISPECIES: ATP-binding protein [Paraburkholderia]ORC49636.1 ATPase [Burkholderia sp. A27]MDR6411628.1 putative kinase [Paraburkholderia terricola]MDR6449307.1 putative kinase [Paraburkholderia terricola]MDR6484088.1 putative kinase [Paraburkholderia terricola]MDR6493890.1 putative kinase [Paraburkholderia terricola]
MTRLVFFCGHAGTGKTTLAKKLIGPLMKATASPFCLLDKDTLYGSYSAAAMGMLTGDPNDRDSPLFLEHLREPEYRGLLDTARDNLALGVSALVVGPLSREVRERRLFDRAWLGVDANVALRVVWVHTSEETAHQRIVARGNPNDAYKLAHWDEYRQRRFVPSGDLCEDLLMFDNTAPAAADYEALLARIVGEPLAVSGMPPVPV